MCVPWFLGGGGYCHVLQTKWWGNVALSVSALLLGIAKVKMVHFVPRLNPWRIRQFNSSVNLCRCGGRIRKSVCRWNVLWRLWPFCHYSELLATLHLHSNNPKCCLMTSSNRLWRQRSFRMLGAPNTPELQDSFMTPHTTTVPHRFLRTHVNIRA